MPKKESREQNMGVKQRPASRFPVRELVSGALGNRLEVMKCLEMRTYAGTALT